ncbi:hypothetical protein JST97_22970 [bacterium]|nr:hypothetical protein [bacterium]
MSYLSTIDELSNPWLCQQVLTDHLSIQLPQLLGNQALAEALESQWLQVVGIHQARACSASGTLKLTYDLRRFNRQQLKARVARPA